MMTYSTPTHTVTSFATLPATLFRVDGYSADELVDSRVYMQGNDVSEFFTDPSSITDDNAQSCVNLALRHGLEVEFEYCTYSTKIAIDVDYKCTSCIYDFYTNTNLESITSFLADSSNQDIAMTITGLIDFEQKFIKLFGGEIGTIFSIILNCAQNERPTCRIDDYTNICFEKLMTMTKQLSTDLFDGEYELTLPCATVELIMTHNDADNERFNTLCELVDSM